MIVHCSHDEMVKLSDLKSHPKNRNKHPEDQIKRLADILTYQGWRYPVKVSKRSGLVTSGHGRIEAARLNGWEHAPVSFQDYDTDEQEYADVQADNAIASWAELDLSGINTDVTELGPDFDIDMLGIKGFTIDVAEPPPEDGNGIPDKVETRSQLGDIWQVGRHRLMCGDSTSVDAIDQLMDKVKADMVFTDPPYGMKLDTDFSGIKGSLGRNHGTTGNKYDKVIGDHEDFSPELINTIFASFGYCKEIFIFGADYFAELIPQKNEGSWLVWDKRKESQADAIGAEFELCWSKNKHKRRMLRHDWFGFLSSKNTQDARNRVHPTQKPITLIEDIMEQWGEVDDAVVDLYGGSGSTLIACEKNKRRCFMMELAPEYCDVILARWEKYTGKTAELLNGPQES